MYASTSTKSSTRPSARGEAQQEMQPPQPQPQQQPQEQMLRLKPPRVRGSCDSCATAKVRCSKDRPSCERCIECNLSCVYGLSMKHGKGAQKRRQPEAQTGTSIFGFTPISSEQKYESDLRRSFSELLENVGSSVNVSSPHLWPSGNDVIVPQKIPFSTPSGSATSAYDNPLWSASMHMSQVGTNVTQPPNSATHDHANGYPTAFDDNISFVPNADFSQHIHFESPESISPPSSSASPATPSKMTPPFQSQISNNNSATHDCHAIVNSTLAILHVSSRQTPVTETIDAMATFSSTSGVSPTAHPVQHLDEVLCCTRKAIGNVAHLLKCSCASDPQMALLTASIIIRILNGHQIAAGVNTPTSTALPSWDGSLLTEPTAPFNLTACRSHRDSPYTSAAFIASERVQIGNYVPNQEDQESIRRMFLLISLKKLGRLIDMFAHVGDPADLGTGHLRDTLASWLNSELSQAIKLVGKGPNTANSH